MRNLPAHLITELSGKCSDDNDNQLHSFVMVFPGREERVPRSGGNQISMPGISICEATEQFSPWHGSGRTVWRGLHLPFLSTGLSFSSWFHTPSEESSFVAVIAILASSLLRTRQWLPIAS